MGCRGLSPGFPVDHGGQEARGLDGHSSPCPATPRCHPSCTDSMLPAAVPSAWDLHLLTLTRPAPTQSPDPAGESLRLLSASSRGSCGDPVRQPAPRCQASVSAGSREVGTRPGSPGRRPRQGLLPGLATSLGPPVLLAVHLGGHSRPGETGRAFSATWPHSCLSWQEDTHRSAFKNCSAGEVSF